MHQRRWQELGLTDAQLISLHEDIRARMARITEMVDLALGTPVTTEQREYLEEIRTAAESFCTSLVEARSGRTVDDTKPGSAGFLVTPIRESDLVAVMSELSGATHVEPATAVPSAADSAGRTRVLLVEDNVINQRVAIRLLTSRGHAVTAVTNGRDALAAGVAAAVDVILIDLQITNPDALETTAQIREHEQGSGRRTRIIGITSASLASDRDRCIAAGMDGVLKKPIDRQALFEAIEQDTHVGDISRVGQVPAFGRAGALRRLDGSEPLLTAAIASFIDEVPAFMRSIEAAIDNADAARLCRAAHDLKEAAGRIGAAGVVDAARALEILGTHNLIDDAPEAWTRLNDEVAYAVKVARSRAGQPAGIDS